MATEKDVNEPIPKLTTKLRSEIMPLEPFQSQQNLLSKITKKTLHGRNKKPLQHLKMKKDSKNLWPSQPAINS